MAELKWIRILGAFVLTLAAFGAVAQAQQVPREVNFQGRLSDSGGNPIASAVSVTFSVYAVPSGGVALWTETQSVTPDGNGVYSVRLGAVNPIYPALGFDTAYWLGIQVGSDPEMVPRYAMGTAPYAFRAVHLEVPGQASGDLLYYDGARWSRVAPGSAGDVLTTQGAGNAPTWTSVSGAGHGTTSSISDHAEVGAMTEQQGDVFFFNGANWTRLAPGSAGQVLTTQGVGANPSWTSPLAGHGTTNSISDHADIAAMTEAQGDILYHNGAAWTRLAAGAAGQYLQSQGAGSNPQWATPASGHGTGNSISDHADVGAMTEAQGDVLFHNGANWTRLPAGTSGWVLTTQGVGSNPQWTAPGAGNYLLSNANTQFSGGAGAAALTVGSGAQADALTLAANAVLNVNAAATVNWGPAGIVTNLNADQLDGQHGAFYSNITNLSHGGQLQGDVLYFDGTNWNRLAAGSVGDVLTTQGAGSNPTWTAPLAHGTGNSISDHADVGAMTEAQGDILYHNGTNWTRLPAGTAGRVLTTQGAGNNPAWMPVGAGNYLLSNANTMFSGSGGPAVLAIGNGTQADTLGFQANAQVMFQPGPAGGTTVGGSINMAGGASQWLQVPRMTTAQENAMTAGWGANEAGRIWMNAQSGRGRMWDGSNARNLY
ncbi:MAG: hypothetical protein ACYS47_12875 [Planctomycetota bacterium]|jgi:hypothetical protein